MAVQGHSVAADWNQQHSAVLRPWHKRVKELCAYTCLPVIEATTAFEIPGHIIRRTKHTTEQRIARVYLTGTEHDPSHAIEVSVPRTCTRLGWFLDNSRGPDLEERHALQHLVCLPLRSHCGGAKL